MVLEIANSAPRLYLPYLIRLMFGVKPARQHTSHYMYLTQLIFGLSRYIPSLSLHHYTELSLVFVPQYALPPSLFRNLMFLHLLIYQTTVKTHQEKQSETMTLVIANLRLADRQLVKKRSGWGEHTISGAVVARHMALSWQCWTKF